MLPLLFSPERRCLRQAGLPYIDRPRIPPHSSARTERPPFFWLNLLQRSCCSELTGCFSLITRRYWPREKRWLPALIPKCYGRARSAGRSP